MYRPEGWDSFRIAQIIHDEFVVTEENVALVEAGADAMLEALKKIGTEVEDGTKFSILSKRLTITTGKGHLVFIPK